MKVERQVCKLRLTLVPEEVSNAVGPCHSDAADCKVRALVFQAGVGAGQSLAGRRAFHPRQTDGEWYPRNAVAFVRL